MQVRFPLFAVFNLNFTQIAGKNSKKAQMNSCHGKCPATNSRLDQLVSYHYLVDQTDIPWRSWWRLWEWKSDLYSSSTQRRSPKWMIMLPNVCSRCIQPFSVGPLRWQFPSKVAKIIEKDIAFMVTCTFNWHPTPNVLVAVCYKRKINRDKFRSLTAEERSCSGVWWQWILLFLLPEASRVIRLWLGGSCLLSTVFDRHLTSLISPMLCRWYQRCSGRIQSPKLFQLQTIILSNYVPDLLTTTMERLYCSFVFHWLSTVHTIYSYTITNRFNPIQEIHWSF